MATATAPERVLHAEPGEQPELTELLDLLDQLAENGSTQPRLVGPDGEEIELPPSVVGALRAVVAGMANGLTMTLIPHRQELTTQQAADLLNVSRPYLIKLLERGVLPHHKVGTHRRVNIKDVLDYRRTRAQERRAALEELTDLSEELGYR